MIQNRFVFKRKGSKLLPFLLLFIGFGFTAKAQTNITGKKGLIYIPTADSTQDGTFSLGYNFNPRKYAFLKRNVYSESIIYANLTIIPRLELNINFLRLNGRDASNKKIRQGLGDRMLDIRYLLLRETKKRPSVAIVMSSPFGIGGTVLTHALIATKNFKLNDKWRVGTTIGYGSPYFIYRNAGNLTSSNVFNDLKWQKKSEFKQRVDYLIGPFGGVGFHYRNKAGAMVEYDGKHINVGAYASLFKRWTVQMGMLNADQITIGTSYAFPLLKPSKRLAKLHETSN